VGPGTGLDTLGKISCPCWKMNDYSLVSQPVTLPVQHLHYPGSGKTDMCPVINELSLARMHDNQTECLTTKPTVVLKM